MEVYLFKFSACFAIFWLVYVLFLERQNMHRFKRFYLLGAVVSALTIPLLTITEYIEPIVTDLSVSQVYIPIDSSLNKIPQDPTPFLNLETVLWIIYGLGVLLFSTRFIVNLFKMYKRISHNEIIAQKPFIYILLKECHIPHSFFNYIFFNKSKFETNAIPEEVKLHEETHAKQLHSLDIIAIELLQIVFWFHPLIYLLKHHVKLNHEFLADQFVLEKGIDTKTYQNILLQFSSNIDEYQLSSAINYSSFKKRFTVMKTQTSKTRIWISSLLLFPIIAILFYNFAERVEVVKEETDIVESVKKDLNETSASQTQYRDENSLEGYEIEKATKKQVSEYNELAKHYNKQQQDSRIVKLKDLKRLEYIYNVMDREQKRYAEPFPNCPPTHYQKGASKKQMAEYNTLAKKYNAMSRNDMTIYLSDVKRLKYIYSLMSDKQRKDAESFPNFPEPPPPPSAPNNLEIIEEVVEQPIEIIEEIVEVEEQQIIIEEVLEQKDKNLITGTHEVNGQTLYYTSKKGKTSYYNRWGQKVDNKGNIINTEQTHAEDVIEGRVISKVYKDDKVVAEFNTENVSIPPPPPPAPPKVPSIRELSKRGAVFYYNGVKISSEKAIKLTDENKDLNLLIRAIDTKKPIVKISEKPISINND